MKVLDPGHAFELDCLSGINGEQCSETRTLHFVKREGDNYPGNVRSYSGPTTQEVMRALIARTQYVGQQQYFPENEMVIGLLRQALWLLEVRAARVREQTLTVPAEGIEDVTTCDVCGHVECALHANG